MMNDNPFSKYLRLMRLLPMNGVAASSVLLPSITIGVTAAQLAFQPMDGDGDGDDRKRSFSLLLTRSSLEFLLLLLILSLIGSFA